MKNILDLFRNSIFVLKFSFLFLLFFVSCSSDRTIVNGLQERDANEIIVFLNSKDIKATKVQSTQVQGTGAAKIPLWDVEVPEAKAMEAMNYLDQEGLPRKMSENLLDIFGNTGLVPSERQQEIRYQAGLGQQIANTIKKIDGILDASVIISFPKENPLTGKSTEPVTASVYVKHNGILDDPNAHLITKIKRFVAASVPSLSFDNVTVVGDRAELTEVPFAAQSIQPELIKTWNIELAKTSLFRFRLVLFSLLILILLLLAFILLALWKLLPILKEIPLQKYLNIHQIKPEKIEKPIEKQEKERQTKSSSSEVDET